MNFFRQSAITCALLALFGVSGCRHAKSPEEKKLRTDLRQALHEHSFETARDLARRVLIFSPRDGGAWQRLGQAQLGLKDLEGAKETLLQWRQNSRKMSAALEEFRGDIAYAEDDHATAREAWKRAVTAAPRELRLQQKLAALEEGDGHWAEAESGWSAVLQIADTAAARLHRATCRQRLHRWEEMIADLQRAQELAPADENVQRAAVASERLGKFLPEIRDLELQVTATPNDPVVLADRALLFLRSEAPELALEDAVAAEKNASWAVRPKIFHALALLNLGRAEEVAALGMRKSLRLESLSSEFLEHMSRVDAEISMNRKSAPLYVARAWELNDVGQPDLALRDAEMALQLDAKSAAAFAEHGYALAKLGRAAEALAQCRRATELDPKCATAWQYLGELQMERNENTDALDALSRALSVAPNPTALRKREECFRRLGNVAKAEQDHRAWQELEAPAAR